MGVLGALGECGHHGIRFFQKAAVLPISRLVLYELLKVPEKISMRETDAFLSRDKSLFCIEGVTLRMPLYF